MFVSCVGSGENGGCGAAAGGGSSRFFSDLVDRFSIGRFSNAVDRFGNNIVSTPTAAASVPGTNLSPGPGYGSLDSSAGGPGPAGGLAVNRGYRGPAVGDRGRGGAASGRFFPPRGGSVGGPGRFAPCASPVVSIGAGATATARSAAPSPAKRGGLLEWGVMLAAGLVVWSVLADANGGRRL